MLDDQRYVTNNFKEDTNIYFRNSSLDVYSD